MGKKAYISFVRGLCGIAQEDLAKLANVSASEIRESEDIESVNEPSDKILSAATGIFDAYWKDVKEQVAHIKGRSTKQDNILLTWYPSQESCELDGNSAPFGYVNAVTRGTIEKLQDEGHNIVVAYPNEELSR